MLSQTILQLSEKFTSEAIASPHLLEDMAAMEKYMSESYGGRVFVELLQNADDSGSQKILLTQNGRNLVFANDGRCFNESDVIAISRSGASAKKRGETIGYRGIGFKSTTHLTNEIIIYSDDTYFTFSKSICAKRLNTVADKVPTVRIPFLVEDVSSSIDSYVNQLRRQGYTTVFIFKDANIFEFSEELEDVSNGCFLFLNNLVNCTIAVDTIQKTFKVDRIKQPANEFVSVQGAVGETWLIAKEGNASVAFKYENNEIVPCGADEAVYHCYLPTLDKVIFPLKVNCDFSTDPSRKHLTSDSVTETAILTVADLLYGILVDVLAGMSAPAFSNIFAILLKTSSFSRLNSLLKDRLRTLFISEKWLMLNNGASVSVAEYKALPDWFEESEKAIIRQVSPFVRALSLNMNVYKNIPSVEEFLTQYSTTKFGVKELIDIMSDVDFVASVSQQTHGKILGNIIKSGKSAQYIDGASYDYSNIMLPTSTGICTVKDISIDGKRCLSINQKESIGQFASRGDVEWFCMKSKLKSTLILEPTSKESTQPTVLPTKCQMSHPVVSRWRSAEQQCVEMEIFLGNVAKDVSKQNVGYDVESTTSSGEKRFIEVKLLSSDGSSFSITNNEYTAAHQYGDNYYLCLIVQSDTNAKMLYVRNPLKVLNFEKRIRQWEWYCEQYRGEEYCIGFK